MKDFMLLKLLDKISFIFKSAGIDYPIMRKILQLKFVMDGRRVPTIMRDTKKSESKSSFRSSLAIYAFLGLFIGAFVLIPFPLFLKMNIVIGMLIFMIMTTMVSDFSSVLLDLDDKNILLPRPVDAKTLSTAKMIHILAYLSTITIALSGASIICSLIKYGVLFALVFLFELILICGFVILFTSIFYYAILTIFSGEKLKDIINYCQIVLTVFMILMYQFIGRLFNVSDLNISISPHWWNFFLPSTWFAAPFNLLVEHDFNPYYIFLSFTGIIVPIITMTLYVKVVAPGFERNLQKMKNSDNPKRKKMPENAWQNRVANRICIHPLERTFFRFTLIMLGNERKLKLSIYPNLVFSVMMPLIFFFSFYRANQSFSALFEEIRNGRYYLYLYFSVAFLSSLFSMISKSEDYKGAWIYKALPIEQPAWVIKGALKAFLYHYIVPTYFLLSVISIAIFGLKIVLDLVLIFLNMLVLILVIFHFSKKELPFYKNFQYAQNGSNIGIVFFSFALCACLAGVHYVFLSYISAGIIINAVISLSILIALWHYGFKFSWKDIEGDVQ
ncbi:ABC transporter permease [Clostridium aminobutyricum]|uniref:ABC transporter permease n=1 Tax=Clostridium aminobutyricum TaxID=33953 RepID=A0A939II75_CLOAM|nr:ABC transporter permease [Clostridium aminobutyricum]MBN7772781.1 ABC transporter permease [Clostridium aminobutyricum]